MNYAPTTLTVERYIPADSAPRRARSRRATVLMWLVLGAYVVSLATIALWPTHVDVSARGLLDDITTAVPWLTYARIEFTANVMLFIPFGAFFSLLLPRRRWWLPIAGAATVFSVVAEWLQIFAVDRTSSALDVVANTAGAVIGILLVALVRVLARQGRPIP